MNHVMKRKNFWLLPQWYSVCSRHTFWQDGCLLCTKGSWHGPVDRWKSRRWYRRHTPDRTAPSGWRKIK